MNTWCRPRSQLEPKRLDVGKRGAAKQEKIHLPDLDHEAALRRKKGMSHDLPVDSEAIPMNMHTEKDITNDTVMCVRCLEINH